VLLSGAAFQFYNLFIFLKKKISLKKLKKNSKKNSKRKFKKKILVAGADSFGDFQNP